jgi:hypothetical protein
MAEKRHAMYQLAFNIPDSALATAIAGTFRRAFCNVEAN